MIGGGEPGQHHERHERQADASLDSIARFVHGLSYEDLPSDVAGRAVEIFVDTMGCALGGRGCRAARAAARYPAGAAPGGGGVVIGSPASVPPDLAAFWNAAMIRYLDFNDALIAGHPSDMIGALAAVSAMSGSSGRQFVTAIVGAYEVYARLAESVLAVNHTVDHGYAQAIAAAGAVSVLLGATLDQARNAIAMAAVSGVPLRAARVGELTDYKGMATAVSARNAVFFALLALDGVTGPAAPLDGRHAVRHLLTGEPDRLDLRAFGEWQIRGVWFKCYPAAYGLQCTISAAIRLRAAVAAERVAAVRLHVARFSYDVSGSEPEKWDPQTRETADHSQPYVFAHALRHGTVDERSFDRSAIRDPVTLALMRKVTVEPDPAFGARRNNVIGTRAVVTDVDGAVREVSVTEPRGHVANPMTRAEISGKARRLAEPHLGTGTGPALDLMWQLESVASAATVLQALRP